MSIASAGVGRGATVTLQFPLVAETDVSTEPAQRITSAVQGLDGVRVLIVEDMDDAREATSVMLERLGAAVVTARDGVEALAVMAAGSVDVVLCDLRMPRMDGFEFLRALHLQDTHPPVIAVSGLASGADHQRTEAAGFEGHIDKPFEDVHLLATVSGVLARRASM